MTYLYFKALHIIFVVAWFAALFYLPRLFIYHVEAQEIKNEEARKIITDRFQLMQKRLWFIIAIPASILAVFFGIAMIYLNPTLLQMPWMHLKLLFVVLLLFYHIYNGRIRKKLKSNIINMSSTKLRLWNEIATVLLIAIVFIVVLKNTIGWIWGLVGLLGLAALLSLAVMLYKKKRNE